MQHQSADPVATVYVAPQSSSAPESRDAAPEPKPTASAPKCGPDAIRDSLCGMPEQLPRTPAAAPHAQCPADSSEIRLPYLQRLARYKPEPLAFDAHLTDEWLASVGHPHQETGKPYCCYSRCTPLEVRAEATLEPKPGVEIPRERCIWMPDAPSRHPAVDDPRCPAAVVLDAPEGSDAAAFLRVQAGSAPAPRPPSWLEPRCCYRTYERPFVGVGRALRIGSERRWAPEAEGEGWLALDLPGLALPATGELRARLSEHWRAAAALEHASVAAFSRLSLQLLLLGAPAELLTRTHQAAQDEVEHARIGYALASAYAGRSLGPGPLCAGGSLATTLSDLALETLIDGCIEETVGAVWAERAASAASDPALERAQRRIAEDEARHAELAWRILAWALRVDASIAPRLVEALDEACADLDDALDAELDGDPALAAYGVLDARATRAARRDVVREIVRPCFEALIVSLPDPDAPRRTPERREPDGEPDGEPDAA